MSPVVPSASRVRSSSANTSPVANAATGATSARTTVATPETINSQPKMVGLRIAPAYAAVTSRANAS